MLTPKILAAVGLAGALLIVATADASANPWRPGFRAPVMYRAPLYHTPVFVPRPVAVAPSYVQVYQTPVVYGATYTPAYRPVYGVAWRHPWARGYGHRW